MYDNNENINKEPFWPICKKYFAAICMNTNNVEEASKELMGWCWIKCLNDDREHSLLSPKCENNRDIIQPKPLRFQKAKNRLCSFIEYTNGWSTHKEGTSFSKFVIDLALQVCNELEKYDIIEDVSVSAGLDGEILITSYISEPQINVELFIEHDSKISISAAVGPTITFYIEDLDKTDAYKKLSEIMINIEKYSSVQEDEHKFQ
jgi:hypothetical protein